jgi:hypothetical protein
MPSWLTLALTALISGAAGSVITTYGSQTRERRQARVAARQAINDAENLAYHQPDQKQINTALDTLDTAALLAGLPRKLIWLNRSARMRHWVIAQGTYLPGDTGQRQAALLSTGRVAQFAAQLLTEATWQPWWAAPHQWWRTRRLTRVLNAALPLRDRHETRRTTRQWERETIRAGKERGDSGQ